MPEVTVRKRVGKRNGSVNYRLHRWFYRHRPQVAVAAAFLVFALGGYFIAKAMLPSTAVGGSEPTASAPPS